MEQFIFRHIKKYVKKHFSSEYKEICRRQKEIFPKMMSKKIRQKEIGLIPGECVLIRTHTVATGSDSCDYWYVPDKSETAINYSGVII